MDLKRCTALVTGSTDGVGRLVAHRLAQEGIHVIVHGRDADRGRQVVNQVQADQRGSAVFINADFSSLAEVRRLVENVSKNCDRLDILINNAGIGSGGSLKQREASKDGYELRQHPIDFDDVMLTRNYSGGRAYAQSKLAQIMFTFDLARELDRAVIAANCLHPATYMATAMVRQSGVTPVSSVEEGAEAIINLAVSKALNGHSGEFYNGLRPSRANAQAYDERAREQLRALSMRLTQLS
jgi:NAD(P)-dependent dehydrogenase (short-subunit alcohol dehydrogenase family)